jgi:uncharacterized coiled-coil DUF342 family protein
MEDESDIVVRLRSWTEGIYHDVDSELLEAADEIERLRKERDEARREVCELQAAEANRLSSAVRLKGWICFEEKTP